uniref:uncharacterized protein n=1 Tax=Myxine glutinosa TaxID=7769 RepID=UPI00358ECF42
MATLMSSSDADASGASADDSEGTSSGFCCMHVIATHSRVIPLAEKSFKKFKECANLWKEIENTPESKVAHNADRYGWDCVSAAEAPAKQPRHVDDDDERSGRRKRGTPGYHAECYRHFCNITEINRAIRRNKRQKEAATSTSRLAVIPEVEDSLDEEPPKRCLRSSIDKATPSVAGREHVLPVRCVICRTNQYVKDSGTGKRKVEKLMNCETMSGGQLLNAAMMKQDQRLLLDIRDKDLVAMEAKYHKSCYLRYTKVVHKSQTKVESSQQLYEKSYQSFCSKVVEERIIKGKEILRLTKLNRLFIKEVQHVESIDASSFKSGRLKTRLRRSYPVLCFCKPSRQSESDIVFVETLDVEEVVEDVVEDVTSEDSESSESILPDQTCRIAQPLRELFHAAQELKASMSNVQANTVWPPLANDMSVDKINELIPYQVVQFSSMEHWGK